MIGGIEVLKGYELRRGLHEKYLKRFGKDKVLIDTVEQLMRLSTTLLEYREGRAYVGDVKRELVRTAFCMEGVGVLCGLGVADVGTIIHLEERKKRELLKNGKITDFMGGAGRE